MMGTGMMGGSTFGGFGLFGWFLNLFITAVVITGFVLLVIWLIRRIGPNRTLANNSPNDGQAPREILQTRYARGEITREQFEIMKQDLR